MSLPTFAVFMKDDKEVGRCFVNCGWVYVPISALRQVLKALEVNPIEYDYFRVYGEDYHLSLEKLHAHIMNLVDEQAKLVKEMRELPVTVNKGNPTVLSTIRRSVPEMIAKDIISVQPMNDLGDLNEIR